MSLCRRLAAHRLCRVTYVCNRTDIPRYFRVCTLNKCSQYHQALSSLSKSSGHLYYAVCPRCADCGSQHSVYAREIEKAWAKRYVSLPLCKTVVNESHHIYTRAPHRPPTSIEEPITRMRVADMVRMITCGHQNCSDMQRGM